MCEATIGTNAGFYLGFEFRGGGRSLSIIVNDYMPCKICMRFDACIVCI